MIANLFVSTFLSLKAHKLRVFLTMVGIIIGITSVVTISALGEGMKRQVVKASSAVNADVLKIHYTMSDGSSDNFMSYEERRGHAQRAQARACKADTGDLEELTTAEIHRALLIRWNPVLEPGFIWTITVAAIECRLFHCRQ